MNVGAVLRVLCTYSVCLFLYFYSTSALEYLQEVCQNSELQVGHIYAFH